MKARALVTVAVAVAVGWFGRSVWSDDKPGEKPADEGAAWEALGKPGEQHARLKALVGEYAVHGKFWFQGPDGPVTESDSTSSITSIMGDRFLRQEVKGTFQGQPFEGRGVMGYDNGKKKFVSAWIDNMGTGILVDEGEETTKGKVWTFNGSYAGPTGPMAVKDVFTILSDKEIRYESYMGGGDKPTMLMTYKKK
jgi:hypothetical protein